MPRLSIVTPTHDIPEREFFLNRIQQSLESQTFQDFEWIVTNEGTGMAPNTNAAIKKAKGEIVKILFMDDFLAHPHALQNLADNFTGRWLATGCNHTDGIHTFNPHIPEWNDRMKEGINTIGSPSVVAFENNEPLLFDENLSFMLDADLYVRLFERYGYPTLMDSIDVTIGLHPMQTTNVLSDNEKQEEFNYVLNKHK